MASRNNALEDGSCVSGGGTASFNTDDTLNNDYFYDDEFAVPFDAHIAAARHLCRSLTDSCIDDDDDDVDGEVGNRLQRGWRGCRLTLSRSESCLYRSAGDSQGDDEMMSTSERAGDFLVSSSELSDLDSSQRPLFSPLPSDAEAVVPGGEEDGGDGEVSVSQLGDSTASGVRLRCAMYDAKSAKQQYRLSFGGSYTTTRTSSSAEDCARWTATKTVGSTGGAGLTTWRQVSRVQPVEAGFTTWQRLRSSTTTGGGHATARSVNLVEWSKHGHHQGQGENQTPSCSGNKLDMARSGQLLRLYQSSRTASASPSMYPRHQITSDNSSVDRHSAKASGVVESRASQRSTRTQRSGRRSVATRMSADKCVQCLPSFRDRCVQTMSSALVRADKSLQTSNLSDRVMHSALLLSRPLPDLDFLRLCTSSSAAQRRPEVVEATGDRRHSDVASAGVDGGQAAGKSACPRSSSLGDSGHEVSPAASGRSSSARRHHGSDSGLSNNSSSSSGIEPGDSATTSNDRTAAGDASRPTSTSAGPRKPPRSFTVEPGPPAVSERRHTDGDLPLYSGSNNCAKSASPCDDDRHFICCCDEASPIHNDDDDYRIITNENLVLRGGTLRRWETTNCNVVVDGDHTDDSDSNQVVCTRDFLASHPLCRRSPSRSAAAGRHKAVEGLISPTRHRDVEVGLKASQRTARRRHIGGTCHQHHHHHHHHHHQPHYHHVQISSAKPAKSILVRRRQRSKVKHRSWSEDPNDADGMPSTECCPDVEDPDDDAPPSPRPASRVARPVSLPDATVLYAGLTDFTQDESAQPERDRCPSNDGNDDEYGADGEHFRAKKSVSFSEKIFYHSMPSVSPLESPLCPLKLPAAPECRFKVASLQPASEIHSQRKFNYVLTTCLILEFCI